MLLFSVTSVFASVEIDGTASDSALDYTNNKNGCNYNSSRIVVGYFSGSDFGFGYSDNNGTTWTIDEVAPQTKEAHAGIKTVMPFLESKTIVYFQRNSDSVFDMAIETLDRIAEFINSNPEFRISIKGYNDSTGLHGYDVNVSQLRANIVKSYLVCKGVAAPNITAVGFGSENPIDSNVTENGKRKNRRVEIELNLAKKG